MPRIPRKLLIDLAEVGIYHCISRCVRRAFLCGTDPLSGRSFDHRKQWIQERLQLLAGQFGVDFLGFSLMSNHLHLILRNRPDVVAGWSDGEVARRWWNVFPARTIRDGQPSPPQESDLAMVTGNAARLQEVRERLSSVSWFMRCVAEPIARRANREDQCTGRFWEGRYKCQPILTRLQVSEEGWLKLVTRFSRLFRRAAGTPQSLHREAQKHGRRREGISISRSVFL